MSQRDGSIKLFGRKIPLPERQIPETTPMVSQIPTKSGTMDACRGLKNTEIEKSCVENSEQQEDSLDLGDGKKGSIHTELNVNPKAVQDKVDSSTTDQDKVFKKPDRILQCPRCNSLDTKFCYFNNYNVNQPRHFCKNCQRYWTAGGTMRNVPVGAGRRKNKHLASHYRQIIVASDGIPSTRIENTDMSGQQLMSCLESSATFRTSTDNGSVLKFGRDAPPCESMESMLKNKKRRIDASSMNCAENGEELSMCASSVTSASTQGNELSELMVQKERVVSSNEPHTSHHLQRHHVPPWVFPLNPALNNFASMAGGHQASERMCNTYSADQTPMQWYPTPAVTVPGICPPNISMPLQLLPASYWGGTPTWAAGTATLSLGSNACVSPTSSTSNSCCSGNGSPTLVKHPRDTVFTDEDKSDNCVLVPKTLRIDDPNEASRSPIWATLGIKPDNGDGKDCILGVSQIFETNPAAVSRAHSFQEST